ncbi:MAG: hypothetical protein ACR2KG_10555 [Nocardioidaceae bacterium]
MLCATADARGSSSGRWRCVAVAYLVFVVLLVALGGKPYYLGGMYPALLAAGAEPTLAWMRRGATSVRRALLALGIVVSGVVSAVLMLPIVPVGVLHDTPIVAINYDAGETVGYPRAELHRWSASVQRVATIDNGVRFPAVNCRTSNHRAGLATFNHWLVRGMSTQAVLA